MCVCVHVWVCISVHFCAKMQKKTPVHIRICRNINSLEELVRCQFLGSIQRSVIHTFENVRICKPSQSKVHPVPMVPRYPIGTHSTGGSQVAAPIVEHNLFSRTDIRQSYHGLCCLQLCPLMLKKSSLDGTTVLCNQCLLRTSRCEILRRCPGKALKLDAKQRAL